MKVSEDEMRKLVSIEHGLANGIANIIASVEMLRMFPDEVLNMETGAVLKFSVKELLDDIEKAARNNIDLQESLMNHIRKEN